MSQSDTWTEESIREISTKHEAESSGGYKWAWEEMKSNGVSTKSSRIQEKE